MSTGEKELGENGWRADRERAGVAPQVSERRKQSGKIDDSRASEVDGRDRERRGTPDRHSGERSDDRKRGLRGRVVWGAEEKGGSHDRDPVGALARARVVLMEGGGQSDKTVLSGDGIGGRLGGDQIPGDVQ